MMFTLYDYFRSSSSFRVRLALNYKQLDYDTIKIDLLKGEQSGTAYQAINPTRLVPSLVIPDHKILRQSLAIIEYLEETYPAFPLLPTKTLDRAYVRALALDVACDIHPVNNVRVLNYLRTELQQEVDAVNTWYQHWVRIGLTAIETIIKSSPFYTGYYCYQDQFTMADVCLLPQLFNARRYEVNVEKEYPLLTKIETHCQEQHPLVLERAHPDHTF